MIQHWVAVATVLTFCSAAGVTQAAPPSADFPMSAPASSVLTVQYGAERFDYPSRHGAVLDWCASWATDCGWGGAHQFCEQRGFRRAVSWDIFAPGRTWVVGSRQMCEGAGCKGFSYVVCR